MTTPTQPESKTPRTDAAMFYAIYGYGTPIPAVRATMACQLETELATAQQRIKELEADKRRLDLVLAIMAREINFLQLPPTSCQKITRKVLDDSLAAMSREPTQP